MRKHYLDNLRYSIVLLVIFYHIIYMFNSIGIITNVDIPGIPQMDVIIYILYPWFMACLFLISGISAKHALEHKTGKQFIKEKTKKILIPSIAGIFIIGWINGFVTNQYTDMFMGGGDQIPGFVKYLIYCLSGIGPLWYAHELFLACLILLLIRKIDKKNKLHTLGTKVNLIILILLVLAVWGSSMILNTPMIEVYRHGIYIFMFLLGYYVFSHDHAIDIAAKFKYLFLAIAVILGIVYICHFWGYNPTTTENLKHPLANAYAWFTILALLGCAKAWFDKETEFTKYMHPRNLGFYVLHYPIMVFLAYFIDKNFEIAPMVFYLILMAMEILLLPLAYEIISRIPVIRALLLGIYNRNN